MSHSMQFYIDGRWVEPAEARPFDVIDPATEQSIGRIALGSAKDVDLAVAAAKRAFESYSQTTREQRLALLQSVAAAYGKRLEELAKTISQEMGAPFWLSKAAQATSGLGHVME